MRRKTRLIKWEAPVVALLLMGLTLFNGHVPTIMAKGGTAKGASANCVGQTSAPLAPCYQSLLVKFSNKFLADIVNVDPTLVRSALKSMQGANRQPSLALLAGSMGYPGDFYALERQELTTVAANYVDQGKVDPLVVKGYNAAVDKPLYDRLIKQLPSISNQNLDQLITGAILATQPVTPGTGQVCNVRPPIYNPPPQVDPASDSTGDLSFHGDHVIDGKANIYLIFWVNSSFLPASPKYMSLVEQFVKDMGQSPLYSNLLQYDDSSARCPTNAQVAGTFVDTRPFPANVLASQKNPKADPKVVHSVDDQAIRQEIAGVAAQHRWNTQDYHNVFAILPVLSENLSCGVHDWLHVGAKGLQKGSPFVYIPYIRSKGPGQPWCNLAQSPNNDHFADDAIYALSSMLMSTVADPYADSWSDANHMDVASKCMSSIPPQINAKTKGNVTWRGHTYIVAEGYDNLRHGCVLEGP